MLVRDCMATDVSLAVPNMRVREAARKMRDGNFGILPVVENDRLIGVLTDRDIVVRALAEGKNVDETPIREVMSNRVFYCFESQTIDEVIQNMTQNQLRRLPVLSRQKRLIGMLSLADLTKFKEESQHVAEALYAATQPPHQPIKAPSADVLMHA